LKESQYLINFAVEEDQVSGQDATQILEKGHELARLIWSKTKTLKVKA